ncbi:hypothetical protein MIND_00241600 [Mycena indigotica]|uniref:Uncharacterized protein n=1 Tax=Mycena indigotica TaxID=2126181 RepID=A0A8H6WDA3_9AGAR|nr:uncharacterized protein MIND_00241600 [Mycena indigotica]KAF7312286.1 hypothetical protein MIND_00241600 [Mycena indigotica]
MNNPYSPAGSDFVANNPFAPAQSRYPDISSQSPLPNPQYTQWMGSPSAQSPMGFQSQPQFQQQGQPFQQQHFGMMSPGVQPSTSGFQPTSAFGQQLAAGQMSGSSYGYLQGQTPQSVSPAYNPVQNQLNSPGYVAQFDPYGQLGQLDTYASAQPPPQLQPSNSSSLIATSPTATTSVSPTGQLHPREFIKVNKAGVEAWDAGTWKQLLVTFDGLKDAWEARRKDILGNVAQLRQQLAYATYYAPGQLQQEITRLQAMAKDAESNHDSVAASSFQMHEVFANYRQASDMASKSRVREASNAALTSLPDWPPVAY